MTTNDTIPESLRQLLVDAAAALENLTDLEMCGDGTGQYGDDQAAGVRLAGMLRDAAAGRPLVRTWDVYIDTGVAVTVPADIDPDTDDGVAAIKAAVTAKLIEAIEEGSFDIRCEEYRRADRREGWDIFDTGDGRMVVQADDDHRPRLTDDEAIRRARAAGIHCDDDGNLSGDPAVAT